MTAPGPLPYITLEIAPRRDGVTATVTVRRGDETYEGSLALVRDGDEGTLVAFKYPFSASRVEDVPEPIGRIAPDLVERFVVGALVRPTTDLLRTLY